jgi:CheY-like chemotaxis protein
VVALSGWGQEEDRRKSFDAGFDEHFVKPIDTKVLKDLVASMALEREDH